MTTTFSSSSAISLEDGHEEQLFRYRKKPCSPVISFYSSLIINYTTTNPFLIHLFYFTVLSLVGFLLLKVLPCRKEVGDLDLFFTAVSAVTVSGLATVEIEVFTNTQMLIITVLMFLGGVVFTTMLSMFLRSSPPKGSGTAGLVLLGYQVLFHVVGIASIALYFACNRTARVVLEKKHIRLDTFLIFTVVSSFSNCGFLPTNESMMVFRGNSGLLLLVATIILGGNTLFPPLLRLTVCGLNKLFPADETFKQMLANGSNNSSRDPICSFVPGRLSCLKLGLSVTLMIMTQVMTFSAMAWNSDEVFKNSDESTTALTSNYEKIVAVIFQSVNSRHSGESVVDLSVISPAVIVLFTLMMYLDPKTSLFPPEKDEVDRKKKKMKKKRTINSVSNLLCLLMFVIAICVIERKKLAEDPLNFSVISIIFEITSAYGNVGLSLGYSCHRRLDQKLECDDQWIGVVGRWSNKGKIVVVLVMFFGRLKNYSYHSIYGEEEDQVLLEADE